MTKDKPTLQIKRHHLPYALMLLSMLILNKKSNNKQLYLSKEYEQFVVLRMISWIAVGVFVAGTIICVSFIYQSTFFTIEKIQNIISQENDTVSEVINFGKYEEVKKNWKEKIEAPTLKVLFDPFNPPTSTIATTISRQ